MLRGLLASRRTNVIAAVPRVCVSSEQSLLTPPNRQQHRYPTTLSTVTPLSRTVVANGVHVLQRMLSTNSNNDDNNDGIGTPSTSTSMGALSMREGLPARHIVEDEDNDDDIDGAKTGAFHNLSIIATSLELMTSAHTKVDKLFVARKIHSDKLAQIDFTKRKVFSHSSPSF
jgi:hypothetical protein